MLPKAVKGGADGRKCYILTSEEKTVHKKQKELKKQTNLPGIVLKYGAECDIIIEKKGRLQK